MRHRFVRRDEISRRGISLLEVLLILFAGLLLLSLILPAMQQARGPSRRLQCLNNLRTLALGTFGMATSRGGQVPLLSAPAPGLASEFNAIWVIQLLPYMDNLGSFEHISMQKTPTEAETALNEVLSASMSSLQCPQDPKRFRQPGGLSYGANIGYGAWHGTPQGVTTDYDFEALDHTAASIDWNDNGKLDPTDKDVARATGVFWFADEDNFRLTLDDISNADGTGQTILFAETTNLPPMHLAGPTMNGHNPGALDAGFGLSYEALGLKKREKPGLFLDRTAKATPEYRKYFAPNTNHGTAIGKWPAASSMHNFHTESGFVCVVFADGHTSAISNKIDWAVWAAMHTPRGVPHGEAEISETEF